MQGKKVLVAAGDTFRAAAIDQLAVWAERAGVGILPRRQERTLPRWLMKQLTMRLKMVLI